jgi:hypothetical protein
METLLTHERKNVESIYTRENALSTALDISKEITHTAGGSADRTADLAAS